jgi:hypothetical protein
VVGAATVTIFGSVGHGPPACFLTRIAGGPCVRTRRCGVLTVETDAGRVERRLGSGGVACPVCSGVLAGWGHARARDVRDRGGLLRLVPRRARCTGCGATHVLLPVLALARRADTAAVIGMALRAKAAGSGHRWIAVVLGRPAETVRGWLRRFAGRVEAVRVVFTGWCRALAADPVLPGPAGVGVGGRDRRGHRGGVRGGLAVPRRRGAGLDCGERGVERAAARPGLAGEDDQHELTLT